MIVYVLSTFIACENLDKDCENYQAGKTQPWLPVFTDHSALNILKHIQLRFYQYGGMEKMFYFLNRTKTFVTIIWQMWKWEF